MVKEKIREVKQQYCLRVYDIDNIDNIPNDEIEFVINDQLFLETMLMELRGVAISYGSYKKRQNNITEAELIMKISNLEKNINEQNIDQLEKLKLDLTEIREKS